MKPTAILMGDIHLREDKPICRTDQYWTAQAKKLKWVESLQNSLSCKYNEAVLIPVLCPGDVFHHWKPSPYLISWAMTYLPKNFWTVAGNHDLPQNAPELLRKSGLYTLMMAKAVSMPHKDACTVLGPSMGISGASWGQLTQEDILKPLRAVSEGMRSHRRTVLLAHVMTWQRKKPWPGCTADSATTVLKSLPDFDLILTGDNHQRFRVEHNGRLLVNPGSMMRMTADQEHFQPAVGIYYAEDNHVEWEEIPIEPHVVTRGHITEQDEKEERMEAFLERLQDIHEVGLDFRKNMEAHLQDSQTAGNVKSIILEAMEHE